MPKTTAVLRNMLSRKGSHLSSKNGSTMLLGNTMIHVCCQRYVLRFSETANKRERDALDIKKKPEMRCWYTTISFSTIFSNEAVLFPPFQMMVTPSQPFDGLHT